MNWKFVEGGGYYSHPQKVPWSYRIDTKCEVIFVEASGVVNYQELFDGVRKAYRDDQFHPGLNALLDYSEVTDWKVEGAQLAAIAAMRKFSERSRTAIVASGALSYGMSRLYEAYVRKGSVRIFQSQQEALTWLNEGVPPGNRTPSTSDEGPVVKMHPTG